MEVRNPMPHEIEAARKLLAANGWSHRVSSPETFALLVANSQRVAIAVDGNEVVGFARGFCDDVSEGFLSMIVVETTRRHQGIGRALVKHIMGDDPNITWMLRATRSSEAAFFGQIGFRPSMVAMERKAF